ncbi:transketolase family protein [Pseudanabaena sp. BC1403]|uniref:transketolase family protein n=1 Tax=Pseudanabaena sp. BC1403 TaxID=2043171 RepID=UPI000CD80FB1|nr:transketolase C-terminal domain-containing protein [Pseudanabaena sp. BC1403]
MRNAFSNALINAAKSDPRVILMTGDHGYALFDEFRQQCPEQYINAGVAEQNMVGVAAGLAKSGFRPFVYGLSAFVPIRVLEQIKLDVCYEQLPVILVGDGAGVVYSSLGSSHQSTEDIAALRAIPHIAILSPADSYEMTQCMNLALEANQAVYLRIGKADLHPIHSCLPDFPLGDLSQIKQGNSKMCLVATGSMVKTAMDLSERFGDLEVWSVPCIKPMNVSQVVSIAKRHELIVVLEEHSIYGGVGSAIAEITSELSQTRVCRIGIQDKFSRFCGSYQYLMKEHHLDTESIFKRINKLNS